MPDVTSSGAASAGGDRVAIVSGLEGAWPGAALAGPALAAQGAPGDNLALHQAIADARPGEVIVLDVGGFRGTAHCGDLLALAAQARGVAGFVINGAIRDRAAIAGLGFPIFHLGTSPAVPAKLVEGTLRGAVEIAGVRIGSGDLIVADDDGIVVVPAAEAADLLRRAGELELREQEIGARILAGETTLEIFGLPKAQPAL